MEQKGMTKEALDKLIEEGAKQAFEKSVDKIAEQVAKSLEAGKTPEVLTVDQLSKRYAGMVSANLQYDAEKNQGIVGKTRSERVLEIVTENFEKSDPEFVKEIVRQKDQMATGNAGEHLIPTTYQEGFLDRLNDASLLGALGVTFLPTTSGNLTLTKFLGGVQAGYVGELGAPKLSGVKFDRIRLSVKKLVAMVPISNDLIRYARLDVQSLITDEIQLQMNYVRDDKFLYGVGGEFEPRGLRNYKEAKVMSIAPTLDNTDVMKVELGKLNFNLDSAKWVMGWDTYLKFKQEKDPAIGYVNKAEMDQGKLNGIPFIISNRVKKSEDGKKEDMFLVLPRYISAIIGQTVSITTSNETSIKVGDDIMSTFANDFTLVKGQIEDDFAPDFVKSYIVAEVEIAK